MTEQIDFDLIASSLVLMKYNFAVGRQNKSSYGKIPKDIYKGPSEQSHVSSQHGARKTKCGYHRIQRNH